ncbi:hypothetical protein SeMB42_g05327 [Synchytrium endobioticum]|uniref:Ubiquitin-like protease family profile domain-containing protein n=1 Tax=Synchytrium endobioticum TaxID=286115 RepID=A0A507CS71_9FUNG|nr:hypothetical protein SeMB42_g05327 [Synchytrium endobioticum]
MQRLCSPRRHPYDDHDHDHDSQHRLSTPPAGSSSRNRNIRTQRRRPADGVHPIRTNPSSTPTDVKHAPQHSDHRSAEAIEVDDDDDHQRPHYNPRRSDARLQRTNSALPITSTNPTLPRPPTMLNSKSLKLLEHQIRSNDISNNGLSSKLKSPKSLQKSKTALFNPLNGLGQNGKREMATQSSLNMLETAPRQKPLPQSLPQTVNGKGYATLSGFPTDDDDDDAYKPQRESSNTKYHPTSRRQSSQPPALVESRLFRPPRLVPSQTLVQKPLQAFGDGIKWGISAAIRNNRLLDDAKYLSAGIGPLRVLDEQEVELIRFDGPLQILTAWEKVPYMIHVKPKTQEVTDFVFRMEGHSDATFDQFVSEIKRALETPNIYIKMCEDNKRSFNDKIDKLQRARRNGTKQPSGRPENEISRRHSVNGELSSSPHPEYSIKGAAEIPITFKSRPIGRQTEDVITGEDDFQHHSNSTRYPSRIVTTTSFPRELVNRELFKYPPSGKNSVLVHTEDVERLNDGEFLNDVIIDLFIRLMINKVFDTEIVEKVHVYNTFFFETLTKKSQTGKKGPEQQKEQYDRVKKWTSKVDIFAKDFLIIPINENLHWLLAVIYKPGAILNPIEESPVEVDAVEVNEKPANCTASDFDDDTVVDDAEIKSRLNSVLEDDNDILESYDGMPMNVDTTVAPVHESEHFDGSDSEDCSNISVRRQTLGSSLIFDAVETPGELDLFSSHHTTKRGAADENDVAFHDTPPRSSKKQRVHGQPASEDQKDLEVIDVDASTLCNRKLVMDETLSLDKKHAKCAKSSDVIDLLDSPENPRGALSSPPKESTGPCVVRSATSNTVNKPTTMFDGNECIDIIKDGKGKMRPFKIIQDTEVGSTPAIEDGLKPVVQSSSSSSGEPAECGDYEGDVTMSDADSNNDVSRAESSTPGVISRPVKESVDKVIRLDDYYDFSLRRETRSSSRTAVSRSLPEVLLSSSPRATALQKFRREKTEAAKAVEEAKYEKKQSKLAVDRELKAEKNRNKCSIFIFDSLGGGHKSKFITLRNYLREEARDKKHVELDDEDLKPRIHAANAKVPRQSNFCDCGIFVLEYIKTLLNPRKTSTLLEYLWSGQSNDDAWFTQQEIGNRRAGMRLELERLNEEMAAEASSREARKEESS